MADGDGDQTILVKVGPLYDYGETLNGYYIGQIGPAGHATVSMERESLNAFTRSADAEAGPLPEGSYVAGLLAQNRSDFGYFLKDLNAGIRDTGTAAQSIAAAYGWADVENQADINTVGWAFTGSGDTPAGWPQDAKTELLSQQATADSSGHQVLALTGDTSQAVRVVNNLAGAPVQYTAGDESMTYYFSDGSSLTVSSFRDGGTVTNSTTVYDSKGNELSQDTTVVAVSSNGTQTTTRTSQSGPSKIVTVTSDDANGDETITTTVTEPDVNGNPMSTTTTTKVTATPTPKDSKSFLQQAEQDANSYGDVSNGGLRADEP
jgi:hypothetical protein